jgi:PAS domain S-box-containing protein
MMHKKDGFLGRMAAVFFGSRQAALISTLFGMAMLALLYIVTLQVKEAGLIELPTGDAERKIPAPAAAPSLGPPPEVLILNSYHMGHVWSDRVTQGIIEVLQKAAPVGRYSIEYLDCKRHPKYEHFEQLKELLKVKYGDREMPLVIVSDDPALTFALKYRSLLFPRAALVFCGVNTFPEEVLAGQENITGLVEALNVADTVRVALTLHPRTKTVFLVHDQTATGLATSQEAEKQLRGITARVSFRSLAEMTKKELVQFLHGVPADSLVLALSHSVFKDGEVISHEEVGRLLSQNSPVPVYGVHQERLGYGIVGGWLLSGKLHGAQAARVGLRILTGTPAAQIPVDRIPPTQLMFDYPQLVRFDIPLTALPQASVVVNRPVPFIDRHLYLVVSTVLVMSLLAVGIIILGFHVNQQRLLQQALGQAKEELERRVAERTADGEQANERLRVELAERQRAQGLLQESEKGLAQAQRIAHLGSWELDLATTTLVWSEEIYRIFEIDQQAFAATYAAFLAAIHPEDREMVDQAFTESIKTRTPYEVVHRLLMADGRVKFVHERCETFFDSHGTPVRSLGTVQDISEQREVEQEIHQLNQELEERVSSRTCELEQKTLEVEETQQALMNIVEDLNHKTQELHAANLQLQDVDRLKSMFIASMSHELRTPLNSIIGFSSIILGEWLGPLNAEQKAKMAIVLRTGKHLLALINDLIDVSKIEAGKLESTFEEFDLFDLIAEAASMSEADSVAKGISLQVEAIHLDMRIDRRRLYQCVVNLLGNAVKFTRAGTITIRAVRAAGQDLVTIAIRDTGIGIKEEDLCKLFVSFVRLELPEDMQVKGTGLGLYLVKKIATEILGGTVGVTSVHGQGSEFSLTVPVGVDKG